SAATNPWLRAPRFFGRLAEVSVMIGVTLFAVSATLDPSARQSTTATHSVIQQNLRVQPPLGDIDYLRWLRLNKPNDSTAVSDQTRLPMGGRFDGDPVEIQKGPGAGPRCSEPAGGDTARPRHCHRLPHRLRLTSADATRRRDRSCWRTPNGVRRRSVGALCQFRRP